jgi:hypothetical protein
MILVSISRILEDLKFFDFERQQIHRNVGNYLPILCQMPEDLIVHQHHYQNLKSQIPSRAANSYIYRLTMLFRTTKIRPCQMVGW